MFKLVKILNGRTNVPEPEMHGKGPSIREGQACRIQSGVLTPASGTTVPDHIALGADTEKGVACYAITGDMIFEVPCSGDPSTLAAGDKVTIETDGLKVTATKTGGVATVVSVNGAETYGDKILVKF